MTMDKEKIFSYWRGVGKKIVSMAISFKVLIILAGLTISSIFTFLGIKLCIAMQKPELISSLLTAWGAYNGGVISVLGAMREGFKIARNNKGKNGEQP